MFSQKFNSLQIFLLLFLSVIFSVSVSASSFENSLSCADTDRGILPEQPGYIFSSGKNVFNDTCTFSDGKEFISEGYCENGTLQKRLIECTNGCNLGRCMPSQEIKKISSPFSPQQSINFISTAVTDNIVTKTNLKDNKKWAYSLTFDDSKTTTYTNAYPILNIYEYDASLGTITDGVDNPDLYGDYYMTWNEVRTVKNAGWDISSHSVHHYHPSDMSNSEIDYELQSSRDRINSQIGGGYQTRGFVYPYNEADGYIRNSAAKYFSLAERADYSDYVPSLNPWAEDNFLINRQDIYGNSASFNYRFDDASSRSNSDVPWLIEYTHGVAPSLPDSYDSTSAGLKNHLSYLYNHYGKNGSNEVWVAPTRDVFEYVQLRDDSQILNLVNNRQGVSFDLDMSNVDSRVTKKPITLKTQVDPSQSSITVTQNGVSVPFTRSSDKKTIQYSVNAGKIIISYSQSGTDNELPIVSVQTTSNSIAWNGRINVSWSASDNVALSNSKFYIKNPKGIIVNKSLSPTGKFDLKATDLYYAGNYTVYLNATDTSANFKQTSTIFEVRKWASSNATDTTLPQVSVSISPRTAPPNSAITVNWTVTDNVAVSSTNVTIRSPSNSVIFSSGSNSGGTILSGSSTSLTGNYTVTIIAKDSSSNSRTTTSTFEIKQGQTGDTILPQVSVTKSSSSIPWNGTISISWSASDNVALSNSNFYIKNPKGLIINATTQPSGTLNLKATNLYYAGNYTVYLNATDTSANFKQTSTIFEVRRWPLP